MKNRLDNKENILPSNTFFASKTKYFGSTRNNYLKAETFKSFSEVQDELKSTS